MGQRFGRFKIITGPVGSEKDRLIQISLDRLVASGLSKCGLKGKGNVLVARHYKDDPNPDLIGRHEVLVTDSVGEIYDNIFPETGIVFMVGAGHYQHPEIVALADSIVRSNRRLTASGLNLDAEGNPFGHMPELISLADEIKLTNAVCHKVSIGTCSNTEANRSGVLPTGEYTPLCTHHFYYLDAPEVVSPSHLEVYTGPMFSGKTTDWSSKLNKMMKSLGEDRIAVFKWLNDQRYEQQGQQKQPFDSDFITLNDGGRIPAILVRGVQDMSDYLTENPRKRVVFKSEVQFIPGAFHFFSELLKKGYQVYLDGLIRDAERTKFGEISELVCLANIVHVKSAYCQNCHCPATESQDRDLLRGGSRESQVKVGGSNQYEPRCLDCLEHPLKPNQYTLARFNGRD